MVGIVDGHLVVGSAEGMVGKFEGSVDEGEKVGLAVVGSEDGKQVGVHVVGKIVS